MQGILFLHDQAGQALQQLQQENDALKARVEELEAELLEQPEQVGD